MTRKQWRRHRDPCPCCGSRSLRRLGDDPRTAWHCISCAAQWHPAALMLERMLSLTADRA